MDADVQDGIGKFGSVVVGVSPSYKVWFSGSRCLAELHQLLAKTPWLKQVIKQISKPTGMALLLLWQWCQTSILTFDPELVRLVLSPLHQPAEANVCHGGTGHWKVHIFCLHDDQSTALIRTTG